MKSILFSIPLKQNCLEQYLNFVEQAEQLKKAEWKEMLSRYDIHCVKIWHKHINDQDYVFVYHEVGPDFEEKLKGWDNSEHPFDQWFNQQIMAVYDIENVDAMEAPKQLVDF